MDDATINDVMNDERAANLLKLPNRALISTRELTMAMNAAGKDITRATVNWHCRSPRGRLYNAAELIDGEMWLIPLSDARTFAINYRRPKGGPRRKETP